MNALLQSFGLLLLRVGFGGVMLLAHGWDKFRNFSEYVPKFEGLQFMGLSPQINVGLLVFAEVVCAGLLVIGLLTRLAAIPLIVAMVVAFAVGHANDPFEIKEKALLFLVAYATLFFTGPGAFSLDRLIWSKKKKD